VAANTEFDQSALNAPAGQGFQIVFQNNDPSVQHNVEIKDGSGATAFRGAFLTGVGSATYNVPPLAAGAYTFNCTVHPSMHGTLTVK
jgi:plastocyanin